MKASASTNCAAESWNEEPVVMRIRLWLLEIPFAMGPLILSALVGKRSRFHAFRANCFRVTRVPTG